VLYIFCVECFDKIPINKRYNTYGVAYYNICNGRWFIRDINVVNN